MAFFFQFSSIFAQTPTQPNGTGALATPYLIASADHLAFIRNNVNSGTGNYRTAYYKVVDNLDLSAYQPWVPIGTGTLAVATGGGTVGAITASGNFFSGVFDGGGFTISNLLINASGTNPTGGNVGLFGMIGNGSTATPAEVRNVAIDHTCQVNYSAIANTAATTMGVGSLVGCVFNCGLVDQCYSFAEVNVTAPTAVTKVNAGGLIGCGLIGAPVVDNRKVEIKRCFYGGNISCTSGGLIGGENIGGIVGKLDINMGGNAGPKGYETVHVNECFNFGSVSGNNFVGGVIGSAYLAQDGNLAAVAVAVTNNYNSGMVSGNASTAGNVGNAGGVGGIAGFAGTVKACAFILVHNYNTGGINPASGNTNRVANCIGAFDRPSNASGVTLINDVSFNYCDILNALVCDRMGPQFYPGTSMNVVDPLARVTSEMIGDALTSSSTDGLCAPTLVANTNTNYPAVAWVTFPSHYPQLAWAANFNDPNSPEFSEMIRAASALSVLPMGATYYRDRYDVRFRSFNISGTCYVPLTTAEERPVIWETNQSDVDIDLGELTILNNYFGPAVLTASINLTLTNATLSRDYPVEINNPEGKTYITKPSWVDDPWDGLAVAGTTPETSFTGRDRLQQFGKWVEWPVGSTTGFFDSPTADLEKFCNITNIPQIYEIWYPAQLRALYVMINAENVGTMNNYQFYIMQDLEMNNGSDPVWA
ncbi:MAG: hypothetical protein LBU83_04660, partial [Bacteroidales bacterium]|nr:hypothetical protein [Bacteroidales bacterium]